MKRLLAWTVASASLWRLSGALRFVSTQTLEELADGATEPQLLPRVRIQSGAEQDAQTVRLVAHATLGDISTTATDLGGDVTHAKCSPTTNALFVSTQSLADAERVLQSLWFTPSWSADADMRCNDRLFESPRVELWLPLSTSEATDPSCRYIRELRSQDEPANQRSHVIRFSVVMEPLTIVRPSPSITVRREEEAPLTGLTLRAPGETLSCVRLGQARYRLNVSVASRQGAEIRLLPSIQRFLGPHLRNNSPTSFAIEATSEYIGLAVRSLIYKAPRRGESDEIRLGIQQINSSGVNQRQDRVTSTIEVVMTRGAAPMRVLWHGVPLHISPVVDLEEDSTVSLADLSIELPFDDVSEDVNLTLTLSANHGGFSTSFNLSHFAAKLTTDSFAIRAVGQLSVLRTLLTQLVYTPVHNYNGPETVVVSVLHHAPEGGTVAITPASEQLDFFLRPVEDPINVSWVDSSSVRREITIASRMSSNLPPLVIADLEDAPGSQPFFRYRGILRAEIKIPTRRGVFMSHDAIDATIVRQNGSEWQQLTIEGKAAGLAKLLAGVHLTMPLVACFGVTPPTPLVVRVARVNPADGLSSMAAEVYLDINIDHQTQWLSQVLKQWVIVIEEDSRVDIGTVFNWGDLYLPQNDRENTSVWVSADHGLISANYSTELSLPRKNQTVPCVSLKDLISILSSLVYSPDADYVGNDALSISVGDQRATLWIQVVGVNDSPSLSVVLGDKETIVSLRPFVPVFTVFDPDTDDILTVTITSNVNLSVADPSFLRASGIFLEGPDSTGKALTLQLRGSQQAINNVFTRSSTVEIIYADSTPPFDNALVEICVSDANGELACWNGSVPLARLDSLVQIKSDMNDLPFMGAQPVANFLSISESALPPETSVVLRLSATMGSLESSRTDCGRFAETQASEENSRGSRTGFELVGIWTCMKDLLQNTVYRGSSLAHLESHVEISIELWHAYRQYISRRVSMKLLPPQARYSIKIATNASLERPLLTWKRGELVSLGTFLQISISSAVADDEETEERLLSLNASCSLSCLLSFDHASGSYVPYVDYSLADRRASRNLQFFGTRASLNQLIPSLMVTDSDIDVVSSGEGLIEFRLSETKNSPFAGAVQISQVAFLFNVMEPVVQWVTRQNEYVAKERLVLLDGISLMAGNDKTRFVRVRVECEGSVQTTITIDHPRYRVINRPCVRAEEDMSIEISGSITVVNSALARTRVQRYSSDASQVILRYLIIDEGPTDDITTTSTETEVRVIFGLPGLVRRPLSAVLLPSDNKSLSLDEDSTIALGVMFEVPNDALGANNQLYLLTAAVSEGVLEVPLDDVCCIHLLSAISTSTLQMEGTLSALRSALALAVYKPRDEFSGADSLQMTVRASVPRGESEQLKWDHDIPVRRVNDAPRIDTRLGSTQRKMFVGANGTVVTLLQTEMSIKISDVDVSIWDESHALIRVQLIATSSFIIPHLDKVGNSISVLDRTIYPKISGDESALQSLTLEAPFRVVNELLGDVLYISNSDSDALQCPRNEERNENSNEHIDILVNDMDETEEAVSAERVTICSDEREQDVFVSLRLPPEHASLDMSRRALSVSGAMLVASSPTSTDLFLEQDETARVTGTPAFRVIPEVQSVRLVGPDRLQVLTVTMESPSGVDVSTIAGTFELRAVDPVTNQIRTTVVLAQAVGMRVNEVVGDEGTGRGEGESMEACLSGILPTGRTNIQVTKDIDTPEVAWRIYAILMPGDGEISVPQVGATAFNVGGVSITANSETLGTSLDGSFVLLFGDESTWNISAQSSALDVQEALEALTSVDFVQVVDTGPFTWNITFFQPAANVPLLTADSSSLTLVTNQADGAWPTEIAAGAEIQIARLTSGQGQGMLFTVEVSAIHVDPVYRVTATRAGTTSSVGTFSLVFRSDPLGPLLATTDAIDFDAVATVADEGFARQSGGRAGSSMESRILEAIRRLPRIEWTTGTQVVVTRSSVGAPSSYSWTVTLIGAPADFPSLTAGSSASLPTIVVEVLSLTKSNRVAGTFTLSYLEERTGPLQVSAPASEIESALHQLSTVRNSSIGFGRIVVRRRGIRAVAGASFALLFIEQLAHPETTALLSSNGAGLTGLGAFVRTKQFAPTPSLKGTWSFPGIDTLSGRELWVSGVQGSFRPDRFELHGDPADLQRIISQFTYLLPSDFVGGYVCIMLTATISESKAFAMTDDLYVAFRPPSRLRVLSSSDDDPTATRGRRRDLDFLQVDVPSWFYNLLWIRLRLLVEHGALWMRNRDGSGATPELWLNGTVHVVNTGLLNLEYESSQATTHALDILTAEMFTGDEASQRLSSNEFFIRINEPPFEPQISIIGDTEIFVPDDSPSQIAGVSIVDANAPFITKTPTVDGVELSLQADVGQLSISQTDGLALFTGNESSRLTLRGDLSSVNDALSHLYYEPSRLYDHTRDSVLISVSYHPGERSVITSSRKMQVQIQHTVHVPRVLVGDSNAITYAAQEDNGFRFPNLTLVVDNSHLSNRDGRRRVPVAELRRTDLLPPTVTTLKSTNWDDDWRHRWIGDLTGLTFASFASPSTFSNIFFFRGSDIVNGEELWISDGSSNGTKLLADLMPGQASSSPGDLTFLPPANSLVVFAARGIDRSWKLTTDRLCNSERFSSIASDIMYFVATATTWNPQALYDCPRPGWRWATTAEAQTRFHTRIGDTPANLSEPYVFWDSCDWVGYNFGGVSRKYFRFADSGATGAFKHAGRRDSMVVEVSFSTADFAGIVCIRDDASIEPAGREVWISDASGAATRLKDIATGPRDSNPRFFTPFQSKRLLFQAWTPETGTELYRTDGTSAGTLLLEDIWRGPRSSDPSDFAEWVAGDGRMYFAATTEAGRELWSTDGLASGTAERGTRQSPATSGILIGTALVRDICATSASSNPQFLTPVGALGVFFAASDCINGRELWVTAGTPASTKMVKDINIAPGQGSDPSHLVVFGGKLFFAATANGDTMGRELFTSDGTAAGTNLLIELVPGAAGGSPSLLTVANARLYFHAVNAHGSGELWVSDGTSAGTFRVWDAGFARSNTIQLASTTPLSSGRRAQLLVTGNALYYLTQRKLPGNDDQNNSDFDTDRFRLEVSVTNGAVYLPVKVGVQNQSLGSSVTIEGTRNHLQVMLQRLLYLPPLNWNMLQTSGHLLVEWRFNVSSLSLSTAKSEVTTADLVVRPRVDPPVIIVPTVVEDSTHSEPDFLSRLRMECLPITVSEDVMTQLEGFSVRAVDDGDNGPHHWQLEVSASRGTIAFRTGTACVRRVIIGSLSGGKRVSVLASRIDCLQRLLNGLVYTGDADVSGADALQIRVSSSAPTITVEDSAIVPIFIVEVNDAPYLTSRSGFYYESKEDQALVLHDLHIHDPDAGSTGRVEVDLSVRFGSIAIIYDFGTAGSSVNIERNDSAVWAPAASTRLVLSGSLVDLNTAISRLVYTSAQNWNSLAHADNEDDGYDAISVVLTDDQRVNASTSSVVFVYVLPTPDPVLISTPTVLQTSVYAALKDGVLYGDEDEWIETQGMAFTSADDTARASLDVTVSVSHGRLFLDDAALRGVTTSGSADDGSAWRLQGRFELVNRSVATLKYLPSANYYGSDSLLIFATASDPCANENSISTTQAVPILVHAVNDPPQWTLPLASVAWTQDEPTRIAGVVLRDVDVETADCTVVSCEMEVVVETTASAAITFPRLAELQHAPQFSVSALPLESSYLVLTGSLHQLNLVLSEIVLTIANAQAEILEPVEVWFTADDRGNFGQGGPQVTRQRVVVTPLHRTSHAVQLLAPDDQTLETDEDTPLVFGGSIQLRDIDSSTRSVEVAPQYEVKIEADNGFFLLATTAFSATRLLLIPTTDNHHIKFRGFLPQINVALNGSSYVPDENWFGPDELRISVRQVDSDDDAATISLFVNVVPVCDAPRWHTDAVASDRAADIMIEEDSQSLISTLSIEDPDTVIGGGLDQEREVTVSIDVLDGGGVMLATMRGLRFVNESFVTWPTPFEDLRLLFFSQVVISGRVLDLNAALRGLIYRPRPDFHTGGHILDAIVFNVSDSVRSCSDATIDSSITLRAAIEAVNDEPLIISQRFRRVTMLEVTADNIHSGSPMMEAFEGQDQVLDAVSAFDADTAVTNSVDPSLPESIARLRLSCRSCSLRPTESFEKLQRLSNIVVSLESDTHGDTWSSSTTFYGSISALNQFVLSSLVFTSSHHFHNNAVVLLEISDLGFEGRGGPQETAFAMVVRVHRVSSEPQILVPPFGTRLAPLEVDEHGSVLLQGAPIDPERRETSLPRAVPHWQIMAVDPLGNDSNSRMKTLVDVVTDDGRTATSFYASIGVRQFLFGAFDPTSGVELWTSDGTASGTRLLRDVSPGPRSSYPQHLTRFSIDGLVYFSASGPNVDAWRLKPDYRDSCDGFRASAFAPNVFYVVAQQTTWDPDETYDCPVGYQWMTTAEASAVFVGTVEDNGHKSEPLVYFSQCGWQGFVWGGQRRSHFRFADSKVTGAFKHAGHRDSYRPDVGFQTQEFAGIVCRRQRDEQPEWGTELWASDGTAEGTRRVARIGDTSDGSRPAFLTEFRNLTFFQATTASYGAELWASDGTRGGSRLIADMAFGTRSSSPEQLTVASGKLFFSAETAAYGRELWVSDGQPRGDFAQVDHGIPGAGTHLVLDIRGGQQSSLPQFLVALPSTGLLLFQADDGIHGAELWKSDGTSMGTALVLDIRPGSPGSEPRYLTSFNGRVFFQADDGVHGAELWSTDGSAANTTLLVDLVLGARGSAPRYLTTLSLPRLVLVFSAATDRDPQVTEFWISDGTTGGTAKLFGGSREVVDSNDLAMAATPRMLPVGSGFVFFGSENTRPRRSTGADGPMVSRSLTLVDDRPDRTYRLSLRCAYGELRLSNYRACGLDNDLAADTIDVRGSLLQLNCLVAEIVYQATRARAGVLGWDDAIVATLTEELTDETEDDDGRAYSTSQSIAVRVRALNHAPVVTLPTRIFAPLDSLIPLAAVRVEDEDAGGEALLYLRVSAQRGRLRLVNEDALSGAVLFGSTDDPHGAPSLELSGTLRTLAEAFAHHVRYACLTKDSCAAGVQDALTIEVSDNGFSGAGGPQSTVRVVTVVVVGA